MREEFANRRLTEMGLTGYPEAMAVRAIAILALLFLHFKFFFAAPPMTGLPPTRMPQLDGSQWETVQDGFPGFIPPMIGLGVFVYAFMIWHGTSW